METIRNTWFLVKSAVIVNDPSAARGRLGPEKLMFIRVGHFPQKSEGKSGRVRDSKETNSKSSVLLKRYKSAAVPGYLWISGAAFEEAIQNQRLLPQNINGDNGK